MPSYGSENKTSVRVFFVTILPKYKKLAIAIVTISLYEDHNSEPFDKSYFSCLKIFQQLSIKCETGGIKDTINIAVTMFVGPNMVVSWDDVWKCQFSGFKSQKPIFGSNCTGWDELEITLYTGFMKKQ